MTELVIDRPKWVLSTKRGWGMVISGLAAMAPLVDGYCQNLIGISCGVPMINMVGEAGAQFVDAAAWMVGIGLWVYGSFRPTAPLSLTKPAAE